MVIPAALVLLLAADKPALPTHTFDPAQAGEAAAPVGEYAGQLGGRGFGAQIAACGGGAMRLVIWPGGLPGAGAEASGRLALAGTRAAGAATFAGEGWSATWQAGSVTLVGPDGARGQLARVERESPTLGAAPPAGAIVIFDGTDRGEFRGKARISDGTVAAGWGGRRMFGDVDLHVEFQLPFHDHTPDDTNVRLNSTVSLALEPRRGQTYGEFAAIVIVNDALGAQPTDLHCGGLRRVAAPTVNMCFPPLRWQTFDIEYRHGDSATTPPRPPRITVRHNGVLVQREVELPLQTLKLAERGPELVHLHTAAHGYPVRYRNVWAIERGAAAGAAAETAPPGAAKAAE